MEYPVGDDIDDIFAMILNSEKTDTSETETQTTSASTTAKFITATVNEDSGSTTYKPFSDLVALFSSATEDSSSVALNPRTPGMETATSSSPTTYTSTYMESTEQPLITPSTENLTFEKQPTATEDMGANTTPSKSMAVANAVTAVFLFVLASSIALAFATGWAPRILGLRLPAIRKNTSPRTTAQVTMTPSEAEAADAEKWSVSPLSEDGVLGSANTLTYGNSFGNTQEEKDVWLQKWNRGKAKLLSTLRK